MSQSTYTVYCISGLAADERIFSQLKLNIDIHHIKWIQPGNKESFDNYVKRLSSQIQHTENVILIGVSFGGMVAIELNKLLPISKTIIISSIKHKQENPDLLKSWLFKKCYKSFITYILKAFPALSYWPFGAKSKEEKKLLREFITKADNYYLTWSVDKIMNWDNIYTPKNLYQIHGSADRIFNISNIKEPIVIKGGTHFMVYNKAEEISNIINNILEN